MDSETHNGDVRAGFERERAHVSGLTRYSASCAVCVFVLGAMVILGWALEAEPLKRVAPGLVAMNPTTALLFMLAGVALFSLQARRISVTSGRIASTCAAVMAAVAVLKLLAYSTGWSVPVDQLVFAGQLFDAQTNLQNQIAPNTALNILLSATALLLVNVETRNGHRPAQFIAAAVTGFSLLALAGYAFGTALFYRITSFIPMAVHTGVGFLLLSTGILCARPERGFMRIVSSDGVGGTMVRRLLPAAVAVPALLGWLRFLGEKAGYYDTGFGVSLTVVSSIIGFGTIVVWQAVVLDRADRKRKEAESKIMELNAELEKRAVLLETSNKELEAFSYSVSHDLRAPLRHIDGYADLARKAATGIDEMGRRYLTTISESAKQMGRLIDDLLVFSRMSRAELRQTTVDLNTLVEETTAHLESELNGRNVEWKKGRLPTVTGDAAMLRQVFVKLLSNAVKYTGPRNPAIIEIGCVDEKADESVVFVRDNGVGFDMEYAGKLFGVFQRLHSSDDFEGTGIGLANVRRIIQRHGGRTWAEGKVDGGATFYFSIPKKR